MSRMSRISILALACIFSVQVGWGNPTPPIMPNIEETPLPPPVTLPGPATRPADLSDQPLTATEVARIALRHQPSLAVAQMGIIASHARVQQNKAGLSPTLGVNGGYSKQSIASGNGGGNAPDGFSSTASVKQLLFDKNHTRDLVRQSSAQERGAIANLTRAQSDLVFQVKQAYYVYTQNLRQVGVNEANLRNRREHLAQAQARVKAGVGLPVDVVRAETAVAEAILALTLARNAASVAQTTLAQIMGLDPRTTLQVAEADEPAVATDDFNALVATALQRRPEIAVGQATIEAARYAVNAAKTSNAPALVGSVGWGMRGGEFPPDNNTLTLGLAVQWNAFDGGMAQGKVMEAQANFQSAQAQLAITTLAVSTDVSQAYLNEKTAEQRLITANAQVANAQEAVRLAQGRYTAGLGIFLDVLDAQNTLQTAQTNQVNARTAVNQARAALAHALNSDPAFAE